MELKHDNNVAGQDGDFSGIDFKHIKERFKFKKVGVVGDKVFIVSGQDEWFIEYVEELDALILHHKNTRFSTSRYHREKKRFHNIFQIFGYIEHHDGKILRGKCKSSRMEDLFNQIK